MLARVVREIETTKQYIVTADDIRGAFDHVSIEYLLEDVYRVVPDPAYRRLITAIVRGHDGKRKDGIDQGGPLGPLLLNIHLHHRHDLPVDTMVTTRCWSRYADNTVYLTRTVPEGQATIDSVRNLLKRVQLTLKGDPGIPLDARNQPVRILGFDLCVKGNHVRLSTPASAWVALKEALLRSHEHTNPPATARSILSGWTRAWGPTFGTHTEAFIDRTTRLTELSGLKGATSAGRIRFEAEGRG